MEQSSAGSHEFSLGSLRRRRAELRDSMNALEQALAGPAAGDPRRWAERVHVALVELSADFREHIEITEGEHGLYQELRETAPRLSDAVARLASEHAEISKLIDEAMASVTAGEPEQDPGRVRDLGTTLLMRLVRHRQRGSDLVYDAYEFDIGGDT
ncbi:MAG TPA: hemerythrin domain-containing protein [Nocardioidaceae bacterium]|jgi:hypothetical protein|nr:hemerythrin domain-containing protein [Nocardioidaceae bacterium]